MKILSILAKAISGRNEKSAIGVTSIFKEKVGKISFKRSVSILILTTIVAPDVAANGLTWLNLTAMAIAAAIYVLPKLFARGDE